MTQSPSFRSTVNAFLWPLWARNEKIYKLAGIALLFFAIVVHLPIATILRQFLATGYVIVSLVLVYTMVGPLPYGVNLPNFPASNATYPKTIFGLPIRTGDLVLFPILIGFMAFSLVWLSFAITAIVPLGFGFPIALPLLAAAAFLCATQAMWWLGEWKQGWKGALMLPFILLMPLLFSMISLMIFSSFRSHHSIDIQGKLFSWNQEELEYGLAAIVSLFVAVIIAPYARHQAPLTRWKMPKLRRNQAILASKLVASQPRFNSPIQSQTWFENRRWIWLITPFSMLFVIGVTAVFSRLLDTTIYQSDILRDPFPRYILSPWTPLPVLLILAAFYSFVFGSGPIGYAAKKGMNIFKISGIDPFLATRPIDSVKVVTARMRVAIKGGLITGMMLLTCFAFWPIEAAGDSSRAGRPINHVLAHPTPTNILFAALILVSTPLLICCLRCGNPFSELMSLKARMIAGFLGYLAFNYPMYQFMMGSIYKNEYTQKKTPDGIMTIVHHTHDLMYPQLYANFILEVTILGVVALGVKAILLQRSVRQVRERRLVQDRVLMRSAVIFVAAELFFTTAFHELLPPGMISVWQLSIIIALVLPANRILLQIIGLDSSRHS